MLGENISSVATKLIFSRYLSACAETNDVITTTVVPRALLVFFLATGGSFPALVGGTSLATVFNPWLSYIVMLSCMCVRKRETERKWKSL